MVELVSFVAFALLDELANAVGDFHFELKSVLQGGQSCVDFSELDSFDAWVSDESRDVNVGQSLSVDDVASSHAQVLDELVCVLTLLTCGCEEELGESGTVDFVLGEVGSHFHVLERRCDFHLDLILGGSRACLCHVDELDVVEGTAIIGRT